MAKASGGVRNSASSHKAKSTISLTSQQIDKVRSYMYTINDNGKFTDAQKAQAVYDGREDLKKLYPNQTFITVTSLSVDEDGHLHTEIGINGSYHNFGQIRFDTIDRMFHVSHDGYSWKTATLERFREQYKYIQNKTNFHKWDEKMENLIDRYNVKPTKEQETFMSIESRYRTKK